LIIYDINNLQDYILPEDSIISIDFGLSKCGISVKLPVLDFPTINETVKTTELLKNIEKYISLYSIKLIILGLPKTLNNDIHPLEHSIQNFIKSINLQINIFRADERYSTAYANKISHIFPKQLSKKSKNKILQNVQKNEDAIAAKFLMMYVIDYLKNHKSEKF
jgi:putative Holliday junction resolvase